MPGLELEPRLIQEDWGVVVFASRNDVRFWIGLSRWFGDGDDDGWLAHVNGPTSLLDRFRRAGQAARAEVIRGLHAALAADPSISKVEWFYEKEIGRGNPSPAASPDE